MPQTLEQLSREIVESRLPSQEELDQLIGELPETRRPKDAQELARELVRLHKLTAYQAQQLFQGKGKSLHLGNYLVLDKIGQGGMGMVLKAEHQRMRRVVALKVIRTRSVEAPSALKRFHREVEAAAKLIHPNIVTAFDADESDGRHFLVMEFADGTDLSTLVKLDGPLAVDLAVSCMLQAARGLEYAHSRGIVHRDIKPRNLLLGRDGVLKILDMGLARVETSTGAEVSDLTCSGQIMGTVDYMAPEQAVNPKNADERADVYSLGVTLWYLLTGRHLYEGETVLEKLVAHREQKIPSLVEVCAEATPELDAVFQRMVAKKPQQRYRSMTELIADLDRCRIDPCSSPTINLEPEDGKQLKAFLEGISSSGGQKGAAAVAAASANPKTAVSSETLVEGDSTTDADSLSGSSAVIPLAAPMPAAVATKKVTAAKPAPAAKAARPQRIKRRGIPVATVVIMVVAIAAIAAAALYGLRPSGPAKRPKARSTAQIVLPNDVANTSARS